MRCRAATSRRSASSARSSSTSHAARSDPSHSSAPPFPQIEDTLLSDDAITFLQRCSRYDIDRLNPQATQRAIAEPISHHGRSIDATALERAVAATSGYAFMVQLVGFHSWQADTNSPVMADEHVTAGITEAQRRIGRMVFALTWRTLSEVDRRFLLAMAQDDAESKLTDIADRLGVATSYAGVYRQRLLRAGMILSRRLGPHHPRPPRRPILAPRTESPVGHDTDLSLLDHIKFRAIRHTLHLHVLSHTRHRHPANPRATVGRAAPLSSFGRAQGCGSATVSTRTTRPRVTY